VFFEREKNKREMINKIRGSNIRERLTQGRYIVMRHNPSLGWMPKARYLLI